MKHQGKWLILLLFALLATYGAFGLGISTSAQGGPTAAPAPAPRDGATATVQGRTPVMTRAEVIRSIQASSVKVILGQEDGEGAVKELQSSSGVVVSSQQGPQPCSVVLTNAHAVLAKDMPEDGRVYVSYVTPTGRRLLRAEVMAKGNPDSVDLALVRVEGVSLSPAPFEQDMGQVELGSPVLVASSPFGRELSITSGIISQLYLSGPPAIEKACAVGTPPSLCLEPKPLQEIFKTDAPICYGSSGGGVYLASTGRLVGLVESYQSADVIIRPKPDEAYKIQIPVPGESFLISVNKINYFLNQNGLELEGPSLLAINGQPGAANPSEPNEMQQSAKWDATAPGRPVASP